MCGPLLFLLGIIVKWKVDKTDIKLITRERESERVGECKREIVCVLKSGREREEIEKRDRRKREGIHRSQHRVI